MRNFLREICARDLLFMGCCYGIGALAHHLGGRVGQGRWLEPVGIASCTLTGTARILANFVVLYRSISR